MPILRGMLMLDFFFCLGLVGLACKSFLLGLGPVSYESMN